MSQVTFKDEDFVAVHSDPVWRDKSNFIIRVHFEFDGKRNKWEQLWVNQIENYSFEICCIPFFTYGLSLGDVITSNEDYDVIGISKKSGHETFRVWFLGDEYSKSRANLIGKITEKGVFTEFYSDRLLGVSVENGRDTAKVTAILKRMEASGLIEYENG